MASPRRRLVLNPDARELEAQRIACSYLVKGCERALMRERESLLKHELDEFIRLTAHDLHEPLRMVSCYVQLLERRYCGRLDSDADEFIQFAMDGARRMQAIVDGLSALPRVTSAGRPFRTADLNASVQSAVSA